MQQKKTNCAEQSAKSSFPAHASPYKPTQKLIEKIEGLIQQLLVKPDVITFRQIAKIAGKIISMGSAIQCARLFTREMYKCVRPDGDWDGFAKVSSGMVGELKEALRWLRHFNWLGAPIRRPARMVGLRLMTDASRSGVGYRLDAQLRDMLWLPNSYGACIDWEPSDDMHQAHLELMAVA